MGRNSKAIVLGSKGVNATGLIRSLGMAGLDVTFMSTYPKIESKFTSEYVKLPSSGSKWLAAIINYCKEQNEMPVVFPCDDNFAFLLDDNYEELSRYCIIPNAKGRIRQLADKTVMADLADECGLAVAKFCKVCVEDIKSLSLELPIIIKPFSAFAGDKNDIKICRNDEEFENSIIQLQDDGYKEVMVQKFIHSTNQYEVGIMGMATPNGDVIIPGIINKIRSYPLDRGSTSYARYEQEDKNIDLDKLKKFVRATGYSGIFDIEMIVSDDVAWFIEINFRNGQYGFCPTVAGYNLPYNWYKSVTDGSFNQVAEIKNVYYMNEADDVRHVKRGRITKKEWKKQFRNADVFGIYCKGDMRPYIRQYVKIPDRVVTKINQIKRLIKDLLIKEEWCVAYRKNNGQMLFENEGTNESFTVLKNSMRYWAADPFIISNDGKDYLFFEMFDRFKSKGLIGYREIINGKAGKMQIAYEANYHLSFPFIYKENGKFYMMPESSEGKTLDILETDSFPTGWKVSKNLARDRRFVDSSLYEKDGSTYLFTQELKGGYSFNQLDLYKVDNGNLIQFGSNPIVDSSFNSRLAGKVFDYNGEIIRVSQDCSEDYGKQLNFNRVTALSMDEYSEEYIKSVTFNDVKLSNGKQYFGIHTYNFDDNYEVIDLKEKGQVKLGNIINIFVRVITKIKK